MSKILEGWVRVFRYLDGRIDCSNVLRDFRCFDLLGSRGTDGNAISAGTSKGVDNMGADASARAGDADRKRLG